MANQITLGTLQLTGDLQWVDEFDAGSDLVGAVTTVSVTGAQIIQASAQQAGRRVTLAGRQDGEDFVGLRRGEVEALRALSQNVGSAYQLTLTDDRRFDVMFRRDDGPAVSAARVRFSWPDQATDWYIPTIRLVMV